MSKHLVVVICAFIFGVLGLGLLDADQASLVNLLSMLMGYAFGAVSERYGDHK